MVSSLTHDIKPLRSIDLIDAQWRKSIIFIVQSPTLICCLKHHDVSFMRHFNPLLRWWGAKYFGLNPSCLPKKPENVTKSGVGPQLGTIWTPLPWKVESWEIVRNIGPHTHDTGPVIHICHHNYPSILVTYLATITRKTLTLLVVKMTSVCSGSWRSMEQMWTRRITSKWSPG